MCVRVCAAVLCLCVVTGGGNMPPQGTPVSVNKCCERAELMVDGKCRRAELTNATAWSPVFSDAHGKDNQQVKGFTLLIGVPKCYTRQQFPIYHVAGGVDRLALLTNGHLRHYYLQTGADGNYLWEPEISPEQRFFDYPQGLYCLDKVRHNRIRQTL